ncbi:MAG: hypothetical protein IKH59_01580 [Bacteroidaceae bacterium]|nr:hypothetical protein [Bacteroidaceae bacterium]
MRIVLVAIGHLQRLSRPTLAIKDKRITGLGSSDIHVVKFFERTPTARIVITDAARSEPAVRVKRKGRVKNPLTTHFNNFKTNLVTRRADVTARPLAE